MPILAGQGPVLPWLSHVFSNSTIYELGLVALVDDVLNFATILSLHGLKGKHTELQQCLARRPGHRCFSSAFSPAFARSHTLLRLSPLGEAYGRQVLLDNFVITAFSPLEWQMTSKQQESAGYPGKRSTPKPTHPGEGTDQHNKKVAK